jgi:hypothetical protein
MEQRFLYHALATGASGQIDLPVPHTIAVQAPSALPSLGGYSSSRIESFRHEQFLSFSSAETVATGVETSSGYHTLAMSTVENLNILNVITADRVVGRIASKYVKADAQRGLSFAGSQIENLRIGGYPIDVTIDADRLKSARRTERAQLGTFVAPVDLKKCFGLEYLEDGGINLPEFGKIYLAESLVTSSYQSISMIRVELGCAVQGRMMFAFISTNGEPMPG